MRGDQEQAIAEDAPSSAEFLARAKNSAIPQ
jgi:hypothetical protein